MQKVRFVQIEESLQNTGARLDNIYKGFLDRPQRELAHNLSTAYRLDKIEDWIDKHGNGFKLVENEATSPFDFFRLLRLKRSLDRIGFTDSDRSREVKAARALYPPAKHKTSGPAQPR